MKFKLKIDCIYIYFQFSKYWLSKSEFSQIFNLEIGTGRFISDDGDWWYLPRHLSIELTIMWLNLYIRLEQNSKLIRLIKHQFYLPLRYAFKAWQYHLEIGKLPPSKDFIESYYPFWILINGG